MAKLFPVALLFATADVYGILPPSGSNVCRFTLSKVVREQVAALCLGFWTNKLRCSGYITKMAVDVEYRCCDGWHSSDNRTCTPDGLLDSTTVHENTDRLFDGLLDSTAIYENTDRLFGSTTITKNADGLSDSTTALDKTDTTTTTPEEKDGLLARTGVPAKAKYFAIEMTKNSRLTVVPQFSVKAHTAMGCARKCRNHPDQCRMFNYNQKARRCLGFAAQPFSSVPAKHWDLWRMVAQ